MVPLPAIVQAAEAATPWSSPPLTRRIAHQLAREQGWVNGSEIARALGVSRRTLSRWTEESQPLQMTPARLCLGDPRLTFRPEKLTPPSGRVAS